MVSDNLSALRAEAITVVAWFADIVGLGLLWIAVWPSVAREPRLALWFASGAMPLAAGLAARFLRTRAQMLAAFLLLVGIHGAVVLLVSASGLGELKYFLTVPVVFSGVIGGAAGVVCALGASCASMLFLAVSRGAGAWAGELIVPFLVIALVAVASSLAARNLYTALEWFEHSYNQARLGEDAANRRRAELRRTLNALEEATFRLQRANDELILARQQAEAERSLKEHFVATVSHELRTPLNLVVGFAEMLYASPESYEGVGWTPELVSDIGEMYRAGRYLQALVDDILDLSRIDAGRLPMHKELVSLDEIVLEVVDTVAPLFRQRRLRCEAELAGTPPVLADRTRMRQVLINLLNNAARFTDRGSVVVRTEANDERVTVSVSDTGVGIPEDQLESIFEKFNQGDGARHGRGGAGLGLAISRQIVELHGGQIKASSREGEGSTFSFWIPIPNSQIQVGHLRHLRDLRERDASKQPLLVANDDGSVSSLLSRHLGGRTVIPIAQTEEADEMARSLHPAAVIVNMMPAIAQHLWTGPIGAFTAEHNVPVIRCSIPSASWLRDASNVDDCLTKPVSRADLRACLGRHWDGSETILIVDDHSGFVSYLSRVINVTYPSATVMAAYTGADALRLAREQRPGVILLDLALPDMDGFAVVSALRADERLAGTKIVIITATSFGEEALARHPGMLTVRQTEPLSASAVISLIETTLRVAQPRYGQD